MTADLVTLGSVTVGVESRSAAAVRCGKDKMLVLPESMISNPGLEGEVSLRWVKVATTYKRGRIKKGRIKNI